MRIGVIIDNISKGAGTERSIVNLVNGMNEIYSSAFEFYVISLFSVEGEESYFKFNPTVKIIHLNLKNNPSHLKKPLFYYCLYQDILKIYKQKSIRILIGTTYVNNCVIGLGKLFNRKLKFIGCEHVTHDYPPKYIQFIRKYIYKYLDAVVVLNEFEKKKFANLNRLFIIPNFLSFLPKTLSDKDLNLEVSQLISIGRLTFEKGVDIFLEVAKKIHLRQKDLIFKIYGVGEEYKNLRHFIRENNMESFVFLEGTVLNMDEMYTLNSILISTSRTESFGMTIIEAMGKGVPVISFANSGPQNIIKNYHDGILVNKNDTEQMVKECLNMIKNRKLRTKTRLNALETAENYTKEKIVHLWKELFEELCGQ